MEKIFKWINFLFNCFINICMLFALFIVILYFVWNITPQTVIQRGGYFFSESWKIITGRASNQQQMQVVTPKQVQEAQAYIHHKGK